MKKSKMEYLNHPVVDMEYELFFRSWTAYHKAAEPIYHSGHAVAAGLKAAREIYPDFSTSLFCKDLATKDKWQRAKMEAVRYTVRKLREVYTERNMRDVLLNLENGSTKGG